jgi:hypothetical protein
MEHQMPTTRLSWTGRQEPRPPRSSSPGEVFIWSDSKRNEWQFSFEIATRQGRKQPVAFHIVASPTNTTGLTTELLREIPLAAFFTEQLKKTASRIDRPTTSPKLSGPKQGSSLDPSVLQLVAELYRHAINTGISPSKHIASEMGISQSAAAKRIQRARQDAYLNQALPGRSGESE